MDTSYFDPPSPVPTPASANAPETPRKKRSVSHGPHRKAKHKVNIHSPRSPRARYTDRTRSSGPDSSSTDEPGRTARYPWPETHKKRYPATQPTPFEEKYPRDRPGSELDENARVWLVYRDRATKQDNDFLDAWKEILDVLLVFAGLFSAVCTGFIVESHKLLEPSWDEISARATYAMWQHAISGDSPLKGPVDNPDQVKPNVYGWLANWFWFTSLFLALVVALIAILAKQWIGQYRTRMRATVPSYRHWVWRHRAFGKGLRRYRLNLIIMLLPPLLHIALFLFFAGLYFFLVPLNPVLAKVVGIAGIILAFLYTLLSVFLPVLDGDCPMSTPLVEQIQYLLVSGIRRLLRGVQIYLLDREERGVTGPSVPSDSTSYHEERLFHSTTISERIGTALSWMVNHFRDSHEISVALEAIGSLPTLEHAKTFNKPKKQRALRDAISFRSHHLSSPAGADSSDAERVGLLRACAFLAVAGPKDDHMTFRKTDLVPQCKGILTHDAHFVYQAVVRPEQEFLHTLNSLEDWLHADASRDGWDIPATASSIDLWLSGAIEHLLSDDRGSQLTVGQLATLLRCCIFTCHAGDARDLSLADNTSESAQDRSTRALERSKHEAGIALMIGRLALARVGASADPAPNGAVSVAISNIAPKGEIWIFESLLVWGRLLQSSTAGSRDRISLLAVYAALLRHLSSRTAPIDDKADLVRMMDALRFLSTSGFASELWTAESLVGPLDLLLRIVRYVTDPRRRDRGEPWEKASTTLAHLFHYIAHHEDLSRNELLVQRMSSIVEDLGMQRFRRSPFSIGAVISFRADTQILSSGQIALIRRTDVDGPPAIPSIWSSACHIRARASNTYSHKLFQVAANIALLLANAARQSPALRDQAVELARDLLEPEEVLTMVGEKDAELLKMHIGRISTGLTTTLNDRRAARVIQSTGQATVPVTPVPLVVAANGSEGGAGPSTLKDGGDASDSGVKHTTVPPEAGIEGSSIAVITSADAV